MTRTFVLVALAALRLAPALAQSPALASVFEVASISPCKPGTAEPAGEHAGMVQFTFPGGRFEAKATTLKFLIEWAYDIQPAQHSDGPPWLSSDRYDVVAKAEGSASDRQMKLMLQTLLAERFRLQVHREERMLSALVLSAGKTAPKVYPPKEGESRFLRVAPQLGPDQKIASYRVIATRFSLTDLTGAFARQLGQMMLNQTGLDGDYDFTLDLTPDESRPNPVDPALLMSALRDQLGFNLKSEKTRVNFLVIDAAEKVAAGNQ